MTQLHSATSSRAVNVSTQILHCLKRQQWRLHHLERLGSVRDNASKLRGSQGKTFMLKDQCVSLPFLWGAACSITQFVTNYIRLNCGEKNITSHPNIPFSQHRKWQSGLQDTEWICQMLPTLLEPEWIHYNASNASGYDANAQGLSGFIMASYSF